MFGPYDEGRARAEVRGLPGGFAVGFGGAADRGDFLRRWEDAHGDAEARAAIVAQLQGGRTCGDCGARLDAFADLGAWRCVPCADVASAAAWDAAGGDVEQLATLDGPDRCSSCGELGCAGVCEQGREVDAVCTGCAGGCLECRELDMRAAGGDTARGRP